ncbi:MAG: hypothetical protein Q7K57_08230 [Burkholderiaceae bacterium]|nr:hypothetical protein [Burkholderiaceae bacterium]
MGIRMGTQLKAPGGFKQLRNDTTYYFLWSDCERERVHLVYFVTRPPKKRKKPDRDGRFLVETPTPMPMPVVMRRALFELGVSETLIVIADHQSHLPPWLEPLAGINLSAIDLDRTNYKKSHVERVNDRLEVIHPLVMDHQKVLSAEDPDKIINRHARAQEPVKNETRVRLDFYSYLAFGRNRDALHYPIHKPGNWDRSLHIDGSKRGRPNITEGAQWGHNVSPAMHTVIVSTYKKLSALGVGMTDIYEIAMTKVFGCRERPDENGMLAYYHPQGEPFPTLQQFDNHVASELGRRTIQTNRLGANLVRTDIAPSLGPFTRAVANLMERVEADAYQCGERPAGLIESSPLPHLWVVRARDVTSGIICGIGFSPNSEQASAYRMAQFCEAVCKVKFCSLYGIIIEPWQWPCVGVSAHGITDRGPGSTAGALSRNAELSPAICGIPPSYSGQSKAVIESSNPKKPKNKEAPSYLQSEKHVFAMMVREIHRVILDNDTIDITERITRDLWDKVRKPCPNTLWNVLNDLGRNDAIEIPFEDAVRAYLDQIDVEVKPGWVELHGQRYDSPALRATGLLDRVAASQSMTLKAYVLTGCIRHIWIDIDHRLVELDLQQALRIGDDVRYMSLNEIKLRETEVLAMDRKFAVHRRATASRAYRVFEEETGFEWNGASRQPGRAKSGTAMARQEAAESARAMGARKRA